MLPCSPCLFLFPIHRLLQESIGRAHFPVERIFESTIQPVLLEGFFLNGKTMFAHQTLSSSRSTPCPQNKHQPACHCAISLPRSAASLNQLKAMDKSCCTPHPCSYISAIAI